MPCFATNYLTVNPTRAHTSRRTCTNSEWIVGVDQRNRETQTRGMFVADMHIRKSRNLFRLFVCESVYRKVIILMTWRTNIVGTLTCAPFPCSRCRKLSLLLSALLACWLVRGLTSSGDSSREANEYKLLNITIRQISSSAERIILQESIL